MYINFKNTSSRKRSELKDRIFNHLHELQQVEARRQKRKRIIYFAAASCVMFFGYLTYNQFEGNKDTELDDFVSLQKIASTDNIEKISLILEDKNTVAVEDSTLIIYSKKGDKIKIGDEEIKRTTSAVTYNTLIVPYGKKTHLQLTDGTNIWLNSGSTLIYPSVFKGDIREVYLIGEAIFEVSHDKTKPFFVKTRNSKVQVLGTIFDVSCYPEDEYVQTALMQGKVRMTYTPKGFFKDKIEKNLLPGMIATLSESKETMKVEKGDLEPIFSWRNGYFIFNSESLNSILNRLSRYYKVKFIKDKDLDLNATYSGSFSLNEDLNNVAQTLGSITDKNFELTNDHKTIIIK